LEESIETRGKGIWLLLAFKTALKVLKTTEAKKKELNEKSPKRQIRGERKKCQSVTREGQKINKKGGRSSADGAGGEMS